MTTTAPSRTIRVAAFALLALTPVVLFDLVSAARTNGPVQLGPQLLAPIAGVGLWRGRRWGWALGLVTACLAIVAITALLVAWCLGEPLQLTFGTTPVAAPPWLLALAMASMLAFYVALVWTLTRPDALRLFHPRESSPWGPGMSLWLAGVAILVSQVAGGVGAAALADLPPSAMQDIEHVLANGTFLALAAAVGAPLLVGLVLLAIALRHGPSVRAYLALHAVGWRTLASASLAALVLVIIEHAVNVWLGRPIPAFVADTYSSAGNPMLLWLAIVVLAPISEEVAFRGFLLTGLLPSWRASTAVLLTAAIFTGLHGKQYAAWDLGFLFIFGVALGIGRVRTGSLYVPIAMHATMNLAAMLGTAAHARGVS